MSSCCEVEPTKHPAKASCPSCAQSGPHVSKSTMLQHLASPWLTANVGLTSYFCENPECDIVYFDEQGNTYSQSTLRTDVGFKNPGPESMVCYCFGITSSVAKADPSARLFVVMQTREKSCACEVRNPSGQCCLKHFPRRREP